MKLSVLLVDDNTTKQRMLQRELIGYGIAEENIFIVGDAASARKALSERSFDLLLLDLILPSRRDSEPLADVGFELLRQIVEDQDLPGPQHIVGITADDTALSKYGEDFRRLTTQILLVDPAQNEWKASLKILVLKIQSAGNRNYGFDACFVTALRSPELTEVLNLPIKWGIEESLGNGLLVRHGTTSINGTEYRFVCAHANQMGLVASTFVTQLLITLYRPRILVMTGICGGIGEKPQIGDVIIAEKSWDWQSGKWLHDGSFEIAPDQKDASPELIGLALGVKEKLESYHFSYKGARPGAVPDLLLGPMVSGSAVVADPNMHGRFTIQHRKSIGVDMECYGVYFAAHMCAVPIPKVLCIKAVSDLANRQKDDDFQAYCSYLSAQVAYETVLRFLVKR